jgi:hypothetical protein
VFSEANRNGERRKIMDRRFQRKGEELWENIVSVLELDFKPIEIQTMGEGLWFSVRSKDGIVLIDKSHINKPSSELNGTRKINEKEFLEIYPYYQSWTKEKSFRKAMQELSRNTSYILALINHFETDGLRTYSPNRNKENIGE